MAQRDTFIFLTGFELTNAQLRSHKVGTFERFAAIQRLIDLHRYAGFFHHALAKGMNDIQLLLAIFNVNQPQFADRQFVITLEKTFQQFRRIAATTTNCDDF